MKRHIQKIAAILGMAVILNSSFYPSVSAVQAEEIQSYQNIGDITVEKQNKVFLQETGDDGCLLLTQIGFLVER